MKIEKWIAEQVEVLQDGDAVVVFRLEGADGVPWGTWGRETAQLAERIEATLANLGEELPTGRHSMRLVAMNSRGNPMAVLPQTVQGRSSAAKAAAADAITAAKGAAINIATAESQLQAMTARVEAAEAARARAEERAADMVEAVYEMADRFHDMQTLVAKATMEEDLQMEKIRVIRDLGEKAAPVVQVVAMFLAEELQARISARRAAREDK